MDLLNTVLFLKASRRDAVGFRKTANEIKIIIKSAKPCGFVGVFSRKQQRCSMTHENRAVILLDRILEFLLENLIESMVTQTKSFFVIIGMQRFQHVIFNEREYEIAL